MVTDWKAHGKLLILFSSLFLIVSCTSFRKKEKLNQAPPPVVQQLEQAQKEYQLKQFTKAVATLNKILKFYRNTETGDDALFLLAKTYSRLENWEKAISAYRAIYDSEYFSTREGMSRVAGARSPTVR